jgi:hypothetical protein
MIVALDSLVMRWILWLACVRQWKVLVRDDFPRDLFVLIKGKHEKNGITYKHYIPRLEKHFVGVSGGGGHNICQHLNLFPNYRISQCFLCSCNLIIA